MYDQIMTNLLKVEDDLNTLERWMRFDLQKNRLTMDDFDIKEKRWQLNSTLNRFHGVLRELKRRADLEEK